MDQETMALTQKELQSIQATTRQSGWRTRIEPRNLQDEKGKELPYNNLLIRSCAVCSGVEQRSVRLGSGLERLDGVALAFERVGKREAKAGA